MKSLARTISEGTIWLSLNNIVLKFTGLGSTFLILNYLSIFEYGLMALILSAIPLFSFFILPGLDAVVIADMGIEKSKGNFGSVKDIFNNYFLLQITTSLFAWASLFFGADLVEGYYNHSASLLKIVSFLFLTSPFRVVYMIALRYDLKFFHQSFLSFCEEFSKLAMVTISIFVLDAGLEGILMSMVLSQIIALIVLSPVFFRIYKLINSYKVISKIPIWHLFIKHGKWSILSTYITNFSRSARLWIIKFFLGTDITGIFTLAFGLYGHTTSLIPISNVVTPIIPQYTNDKEKFSKIIGKSVKYQILSYIAIGLVAFTVFPSLVELIVPKYTDSLILYKVMLIALIPVGMLTILNPAFHALRAQKDIFFSVIFRMFLILFLLPLAIIFFGLQGIAYEFVATIIIYTIQRYYRLKKITPDVKIYLRDIFFIDQYDYMILNKFKALSRSFLPR